MSAASWGRGAHLVTAGELAYAAMDSGKLLVPVKVEKITTNGGTTDQEHLRVTVYVTANREPWQRGERMYDLPADHIVSRKATGIRNGERAVLRPSIVLPPKDAAWKAGR